MTAQPGDLLPLLAEPNQPTPLFQALDQAFKAVVGHQLFTLLVVDGDEVARVYSNRPQEYPVAGRKPMGPTPWGAHVIKGLKPFLGPRVEDVRWAFFDHALIESMGLGSTLNLPVVYNGACLGTINLLDAEHHYNESHVAPAAAFAPLLVPAFLQAQRAAR
jgi:hypothetical protein